MRGPSVVEFTLFSAMVTAVAVIVSVKKQPPPPAEPTRLSLLSAASFFCAAVALLAILASVLTVELAGRPDLLGLEPWAVRGLRLASEVTRFSALLPGVAALAFGVAARGAIRESQGALRGRALYRTGVLLALAVGVATWEPSLRLFGA